MDGFGGALFNFLGGNPMGQLSQALAGPQPGPQAAQGGSGTQGQPGSNQLPSPGTQAPAQATQPPGDLAQLYLRLVQSQQLGESFNRNLAMFAGGFKGPPGGAETIMRGMTGGGSQDAGVMLQNLLQMRNMQAMQAAIPGILKKYNLPPEAGALAMADPTFLPKFIESQVGVGAPIDQRQYLADAAKAQAEGRPFPNYPTWQATNAAAATTKETQAKESTSFKDAGIEDFTKADQKLTENEDRVDQLLKNPKATMEALAVPDVFTTSKMANKIPEGTPWIGTSPEAKQQAIAIQKLIAELTGEGLMSAKNVRTQTEFRTLGEGLTAGLNINNGEKGVIQALQDIKKRFGTAHAQVYAVAGKQIPSEYAGLADPRYTSPMLDGQPNPYYTGATYAEPSKDTGTHIKTYNPKTGEIE